MARAFVKHQGHLNQDLARLAQEVIFVTAGIAQTLKSVP
jgi:adenosylcobinamide kinase/adenosylcobinamide-phosphate guanylyltransferase